MTYPTYPTELFIGFSSDIRFGYLIFAIIMLFYIIGTIYFLGLQLQPPTRYQLNGKKKDEKSGWKRFFKISKNLERNDELGVAQKLLRKES